MSFNKNYKVGQILYVGSNKTNKIVPVQIAERLVRETMKGDIVTYMVVSPKKKKHDLSKISGQVFTSLDEAKRIMTEKAREASENFLRDANKKINQMVTLAAKIAEQCFDVSPSFNSSVDEIDLGMDMPDFEESEEMSEEEEGKEESLEDMPEGHITIPGKDGKEQVAKVRSITAGQIK